MASNVATLADAVVTFINGAGLGVTAVRRNTWREQRETDSTLHVIVIPVESTITGGTRGDYRRVVRVVVVVQQRLSDGLSEAEVLTAEDALMETTEDIEAALQGEQMGNFGLISQDDLGPRIVVDSEHYAKSGIYRTKIELNYWGYDA